MTEAANKVEVQVAPWIQDGHVCIDVRIGEQELPTINVSLDQLVDEFLSFRKSHIESSISMEHLDEAHNLVAQLRELALSIEASWDGLKRHYQ